MDVIRTIAKNSIVLLAGQAITVILTYFYTIYTARYLGAQGFGTLSFAIAFTGISCLLADLGLSVLTTKEVSCNNSLAHKYVGNIIPIKVVLSIITLFFTVIVINILGYPFKTIIVIYLMTLSTIFASFTNTFNSIFQALQKMEYISAGRILNSILMLFGTVLVINKNLDIIFFAFIYFFVNLIVLGYSLYICIRKFLVPKIELDISKWKHLLKESIPFWMTSVFIIIYIRLDMIMLSVMQGDEVVGWYSASYRLIDCLSVIPGIFMSVMFPVFSKYYLNSKGSLELVFRKSLKFLIVIAVPIGIGTTILADDIITLFYGNEYEPSVIALRILIWASFLNFINWPTSTLLNSTNKQRSLTIFTSIGALLNLILNYLLIPSLSYKGAGIATVITELVVGLLMLSQVQNSRKLWTSLSDVTFKSFISGTVMGGFLLIFKNYNILLLVSLSVILYFSSLFIVNGFEKEDLSILNRAL